MEFTVPESFINIVIPLLTKFLQRTQRELNLAAMECLLTIYENYSKFFSIEQMKSVGLASLISENNLRLSQVTLKLIILLIRKK